MTGSRLGHWILGDEIGRGTLGVVYRAIAEDGLRSASVKVLTHESTRSTEFLQRFPGDMLALQRIDHPNIARFYESGVHAGTAYFACELVEGTDVCTLLRKAAGLPWQDVVLSVAVQAARALVHAHHRTTLHRGLKPSNLIMNAQGILKLTDMGLAKVMAIPPLTHTVELFGSLAYLAPEQFMGKPATRRSDLYALGGVLYTLLTGRPPFLATSVSEFMHKHCYQLPDRAIQFVPKLPPEFDDLICTLLAKDPTRRPASAAAVIDVLEQIRGKAERKGERVHWPVARPTNLPEPLTKQTSETVDAPQSSHKRDRRGLIVWSLLLLMVLGLAAYLLFRPRPSAMELYESAQPLLATDDPADWDRAWYEFLQPLADRYPDQFKGELATIRQSHHERKQLRRALADSEKLRTQCEEERLYRRGLALAQTADFAAARRIWNGVAKSTQASPEAARWIALAREGVAVLDRRGITTSTASARENDVRLGIDRVREMLASGLQMEANIEQQRLLELYADDPALIAQIQQAIQK